MQLGRSRVLIKCNLLLSSQQPNSSWFGFARAGLMAHGLVADRYGLGLGSARLDIDRAVSEHGSSWICNVDLVVVGRSDCPTQTVRMVLKGLSERIQNSQGVSPTTR